MAFTEDLNVFFDLNDFAVNGIKSDGTKIVGIFDIEPVQQDDYISNEPTFLIKQSDAATVPRGTVLAINSGSYTVRNQVREDSLTVKLVLEDGA